MELAVQKLAAVSFLVIGLSHMLQPRAWIEFFFMFKRQGAAGAFLTALLHLPMGALIVGFHNVWSGIPAVLTVIGWGYVLKSLLYFAYPAHGVRMLSRLSLERAWEMVVAGAVLFVIGLLLAYSVLSR
jgi:uncharacterized protein YjeT (DUF2065 family)